MIMIKQVKKINKVNKKVREEDATQRKSTGKQIEKKIEWEMRNINEEDIRRTTTGGGGRPPLHFFENQKKCRDFGKKCPACVHPAIQNVIWRVSERKNSKIFPCTAFFLDFLIKCLSKCPNFTKSYLPWKVSGSTSAY